MVYSYRRIVVLDSVSFGWVDLTCEQLGVSSLNILLQMGNRLEHCVSNIMTQNESTSNRNISPGLIDWDEFCHRHRAWPQTSHLTLWMLGSISSEETQYPDRLKCTCSHTHLWVPSPLPRPTSASASWEPWETRCRPITSYSEHAVHFSSFITACSGTASMQSKETAPVVRQTAW